MNATPSRPRLDAVDWLRGLVMVVMALDHTRDFFSNQLHFDATDLAKTDAPLFLTRWFTHFCAPIFVFLAGTGAYLYGSRGRSRKEVAWFLCTRGLWLVVLEHTLVHIGWFYNFDFSVLYCGVLWALGCSMVLLAPLVLLPVAAVTAVGILLIVGHNAVPEQEGWLAVVLHQPKLLESGSFKLIVMYPLVPWVGVMAAGFGFGTVWTWERSRRRRFLLLLGGALIGAFIALRSNNGYGEEAKWSEQKNGLFTLFSFLNCTKYPPSLCYLLMTIGPAMLLLAAFDRPAGPVGRIFVTFGRVPLFYYLLQWPLIHGLAIFVCLLKDGIVPEWLWLNPDKWSIPEGYGYPLPVVWLAWLGVVFLLYWPCRWFAGVKARRKEWWLSYW